MKLLKSYRGLNPARGASYQYTLGKFYRIKQKL